MIKECGERREFLVVVGESSQLVGLQDGFDDDPVLGHAPGLTMTRDRG
jgi:hypothetical protein